MPLFYSLSEKLVFVPIASVTTGKHSTVAAQIVFPQLPVHRQTDTPTAVIINA